MLNRRETAAAQLMLQLLFECRRNEIAFFRHHLLQKARTDRIDKVRSKDPADQKIGRIGMPGFLVTPGHPVIVAVLPESLGIDPLLFYVRKTELHGIEVVERKETRDAVGPGHGRNQSGHPVVTMNEIGLDPGDDLVDDLALEGQRHPNGLRARIGEELGQIIKRSILHQMDAIGRHKGAPAAEKIRCGMLGIFFKDIAVVRNRHVNIRTHFKEGLDQRRGDIAQSPCPGRNLLRGSAAPVREKGDFRSYDQYFGGSGMKSSSSYPFSGRQGRDQRDDTPHRSLDGCKVNQ